MMDRNVPNNDLQGWPFHLPIRSKRIVARQSRSIRPLIARTNCTDHTNRINKRTKQAQESSLARRRSLRRNETMSKGKSHPTTTGGSGSSYPYTRSEECSWQPEEVARHLSALATINASGDITTAQLLSHGWSSRQIASLQSNYGSNRLHGDRSGDEEQSLLDRYLPFLLPVLTTLVSQLKEPLILMLLGSAAISILLGNTADAVSIGIALLIVSLVAAVQEYRSEQALEKLASLVPHTCTVLRDGQVMDGFLAQDLVIGDLVLLATGE